MDQLEITNIQEVFPKTSIFLLGRRRARIHLSGSYLNWDIQDMIVKSGVQGMVLEEKSKRYSIKNNVTSFSVHMYPFANPFYYP